VLFSVVCQTPLNVWSNQVLSILKSNFLKAESTSN
jgi:hypothetical protein